MENIELLVHVTAPARSQDDKRYLALAQSIISFQPGPMTKPFEDESNTPVPTPEGTQQLLPTSSASESDGDPSPTPAAGSLPKVIKPTADSGWMKGKANNAHNKLSRSKHNPPYKNPYHGTSQSAKSVFTYETPNTNRRPRTAPETLSSSIQVPRTGPALRRTNSDSTSFGSLASHISNSQPSQASGMQEASEGHIPSPSSPRGGSATDGAGGLIRNLSQTSLDDDENTSPKRRKLDTTLDPEITRYYRPAGTEAYLLLDRSLDWTSSPPQSSLGQSDSNSSTASPSLPLQGQHTATETPRAVSPPIIIISSESSKQAETASDRQLDGPIASSSEPLVSIESSEARALQEILPRSLFEGRGLKTEVSAPQPSVGNQKFVTHISEALGMFARQLPFKDFFRPVEVSRDVKVLERGHWLMIVTIVPDDVAEAARSAKDPEETMSMKEHFPGATSAERLAKYDEAKRNGTLPSQHQFGQTSESKAQGLWTEGELVRFWNDFSSFLENGRAGWGSRLVGEELSDESSEGARKLRIRIFTWGEVLGHMYLALYVLSDKLAGRIPMQWVAGDGTRVVKMSGTRFERGKLPPWSRKGPEGEAGAWGV